MIMGMTRKMTGIKTTSAIRTIAARILALAVSVFGIYVFVKQDIASYLFLRNMFVFFDMGQPLAFFLAEYIAMMGMWACLGHYLAILLSKKKTVKIRGQCHLNHGKPHKFYLCISIIYKYLLFLCGGFKLK